MCAIAFLIDHRRLRLQGAVDVNMKGGPKGLTPAVIEAVTRGRAEVLEVLLTANADMEARNDVCSKRTCGTPFVRMLT